MDVSKKDRTAAQHIEWHEIDKKKFYVIGPSLFFCVRLVIYPPVLIKTRLQLQKNRSLYNGLSDAFVKIYKYEGIRGFYKGFITNTFTILSGQIYATSYEMVRAMTSEYSNFTRGLIAGGMASFAAQTLTVPVDVISQKQMVQGQNASLQDTSIQNKHRQSNQRVIVKLKGPLEIIKSIWKENGIRGFYRGYLASLMTYAPSSSIWWASYGAYTGIFTDMAPLDTPKVLIQGISGPLAGITAAVATNPFDIIRTRLQVSCRMQFCKKHKFQNQWHLIQRLLQNKIQLIRCIYNSF